MSAGTGAGLVVVAFRGKAAVARPFVGQQACARPDLLQDHAVQGLGVSGRQHVEVDESTDIRRHLFDGDSDDALGITRTTSSVTAVTMAADIRLIDLNHALQHLGLVAMGHRSTQQHEESIGGVVMAAQMFAQRHGRDALLVGHQVNGQEHFRQRQLRLLEDRAGSDARLTATGSVGAL